MKTFDEVFAGIEFPIHASPPEEELRFLFDTVMANARINPDILEIGTGPGASTLALAGSHEGATVNTYDLYPKLFSRGPEDTGYIFKNRPEYRRIYQNFHSFKHEFEDERYDVIYIDGEHIHPSPLLDFITAIQHASQPQCMVILHDIDINLHYICPYGHGAEHLWDALMSNRFRRDMGRKGMMGWVMLDTTDIYNLCRDVMLDYQPNLLTHLRTSKDWNQKRNDIYLNHTAENP